MSLPEQQLTAGEEMTTSAKTEEVWTKMSVYPLTFFLS